MEHVTELFHQGFAVFLFCIAVTVLIVSYRGYLTALDAAKEIQKDDIIYEQHFDSEENIITRGEIISSLFNQLEYDIEIDGFLISKSEKVKENITTYTFDHTEYLKSYAYDNKGNITRIIFKGL